MLAESGSFQPTPPARAATSRLECSRHRGLEIFQPTPPARAATLTVQWLRHHHFNPRRPRGRRPIVLPGVASRAFQPTPPARAATEKDSPPPSGRHFNPRRPRGRRRAMVYCSSSKVHFNPRRPRGRRRKLALSRAPPIRVFQPTPPARAATAPACCSRPRPISTHAARAGGDGR